jgi:hypothetical protein
MLQNLLTFIFTYKYNYQMFPLIIKHVIKPNTGSQVEIQFVTTLQKLFFKILY